VSCQAGYTLSLFPTMFMTTSLFSHRPEQCRANDQKKSDQDPPDVVWNAAPCWFSLSQPAPIPVDTLLPVPVSIRHSHNDTSCAQYKSGNVHCQSREVGVSTSCLTLYGHGERAILGEAEQSRRGSSRSPVPSALSCLQKKAAEVNSAAFASNVTGSGYHMIPLEKMMLSKVRFKVLLVKFCITMPGWHVTCCPTVTFVPGMATHVLFPPFSMETYV